jgi:hypothetical protein
MAFLVLFSWCRTQRLKGLAVRIAIASELLELLQRV